MNIGTNVKEISPGLTQSTKIQMQKITKGSNVGHICQLWPLRPFKKKKKCDSIKNEKWKADRYSAENWINHQTTSVRENNLREMLSKGFVPLISHSPPPEDDLDASVSPLFIKPAYKDHQECWPHHKLALIFYVSVH